MNRSEITFENLEQIEASVQRLRDDLGYITLSEVKSRLQADTVGRVDFSAVSLAPFLVDEDADGVPTFPDLEEITDEDLARAVGHWLRQHVHDNMVGRNEAKFKVSLWSPKNEMPPPPPAPLRLSLFWSMPPAGALESLVAAMGKLGVTLDVLPAESDDALVITTSERFGEFTHTVAAFLGPKLTMSGETPPIERLIERSLHAAIRARWGEDPPQRFEIGFHCGPYPWNRGDTHLRFTAPETDEAAVQERFGRDLDILYRVLQDIRPERIVLNLAVPPGVALRIGWVFREITQMPVTFTGGPPFPDPFESADPNASSDKLSLDHKGDGSESNLDIVVLPTPNGQLELYRRWRDANTAPTLAFIHDAKLMIPTGDILAWARALHTKLLQNRQGPTGPRTIRLFLSGPISLTYALGRLLNAVDLRIMDRAPPTADQPERYVERFTLRR